MEPVVSCVKTAITEEDADFDDFHENYSLGVILGRGGFGTVYAAVRNRDGLAVAVKHILKNRVQSWGKVRKIFVKFNCFEIALLYRRRQRRQKWASDDAALLAKSGIAPLIADIGTLIQRLPVETYKLLDIL
jgi:serine/threonine protein kinase